MVILFSSPAQSRLCPVFTKLRECKTCLVFPRSTICCETYFCVKKWRYVRRKSPDICAQHIFLLAILNDRIFLSLIISLQIGDSQEQPRFEDLSTVFFINLDVASNTSSNLFCKCSLVDQLMSLWLLFPCGAVEHKGYQL